MITQRYNFVLLKGIKCKLHPNIFIIAKKLTFTNPILKNLFYLILGYIERQQFDLSISTFLEAKFTELNTPFIHFHFVPDIHE